jgi:hypothetical protein
MFLARPVINVAPQQWNDNFNSTYFLFSVFIFVLFKLKVFIDGAVRLDCYNDERGVNQSFIYFYPDYVGCSVGQYYSVLRAYKVLIIFFIIFISTDSSIVCRSLLPRCAHE